MSFIKLLVIEKKDNKVIGGDMGNYADIKEKTENPRKGKK